MYVFPSTCHNLWYHCMLINLLDKPKHLCGWLLLIISSPLTKESVLYLFWSIALIKHYGRSYLDDYLHVFKQTSRCQLRCFQACRCERCSSNLRLRALDQNPAAGSSFSARDFSWLTSPANTTRNMHFYKHPFAYACALSLFLWLTVYILQCHSCLDVCVLFDKLYLCAHGCSIWMLKVAI